MPNWNAPIGLVTFLDQSGCSTWSHELLENSNVIECLIDHFGRGGGANSLVNLVVVTTVAGLPTAIWD